MRPDKSKEMFDGEPVVKFNNAGDRRNFIKYAALLGAGSSLAFAACAEEDTAGDAVTGTSPGPEDSPAATAAASPQVPQSDLDILNYALTLEFLEAEFYQQGTQGNLLSGRELEIAQAVGAHEQAHVDTLMQTIESLGGTPTEKPEFKFPSGTFEDKNKFLMTAVTFEELGVDAYHGQVKNIMTPDLLAAAASIAGVESRHAAVLQKLIGGKPFPAPFEDSKPMDAVLDAAKPFIAS